MHNLDRMQVGFGQEMGDYEFSEGEAFGENEMTELAAELMEVSSDAELDNFSVSGSPKEILALHEALEEFALRDPVKAKLVELRFFGGLTLVQAAEYLEISLSSADRSWRYARASATLEVTAVIASVTLPVFVTVSVCGIPDVPTNWEGKETLVGLRDSAALILVPAREICCGLSPALSVMVTTALF